MSFRGRRARPWKSWWRWTTPTPKTNTGGKPWTQFKFRTRSARYFSEQIPRKYICGGGGRPRLLAFKKLFLPIVLEPRNTKYERVHRNKTWTEPVYVMCTCGAVTLAIRRKISDKMATARTLLTHTDYGRKTITSQSTPRASVCGLPI